MWIIKPWSMCCVAGVSSMTQFVADVSSTDATAWLLLAGSGKQDFGINNAGDERTILYTTVYCTDYMYNRTAEV